MCAAALCAYQFQTSCKRIGAAPAPEYSGNSFTAQVAISTQVQMATVQLARTGPKPFQRDMPRYARATTGASSTCVYHGLAPGTSPLVWAKLAHEAYATATENKTTAANAICSAG